MITGFPSFPTPRRAAVGCPSLSLRGAGCVTLLPLLWVVPSTYTSRPGRVFGAHESFHLAKTCPLRQTLQHILAVKVEALPSAAFGRRGGRASAAVSLLPTGRAAQLRAGTRQGARLRDVGGGGGWGLRPAAEPEPRALGPRGRLGADWHHFENKLEAFLLVSNLPV